MSRLDCCGVNREVGLASPDSLSALFPCCPSLLCAGHTGFCAAFVCDVCIMKLRRLKKS